MSKKDFGEVTNIFKSSPQQDQTPIIQEEEVKEAIRKLKKRATPRKEATAKWTTLDKVNVLLSPQQKDFLDSLAKRIMRNRKAGDERITANTILRCLVDALEVRSDWLDLNDISDEDSLRKRVSQSLSY